MEFIKWKRCLDNQRHCWDKLQVADLWNQSPWSLQPCSCRSSLDPCGPQMATGCNMFWRFAAIFMLFPPRVQRCWRKDWKIMGNHKHSQTFPNHLHPNPSTNIHLHPRILPSSLSAMSTLRLHILWRNLLGFRRHAVVVHLCHLMRTRNVLNPWHDIAEECWGGWKSMLHNDG